jgi:hypothetical protein
MVTSRRLGRRLQPPGAAFGARHAQPDAVPGVCYPLASRHSYSHRHRHVQSATDATALRGLAQLRDLRIVERSGDDDLGVDAGDPSLGFGGAKARFESAEWPLLSFGEPPNVRQLSGPDGAEQHLRR